MRSLLAASATLRPGQIVPKNQPEILLQSELVESDGKHQDGVLVKATRWVWQEIQAAIQQDPTVLTHFAQNPRAFEEFIAGAYEKDGWDEVILTPRSNDGFLSKQKPTARDTR